MKNDGDQDAGGTRETRTRAAETCHRVCMNGRCRIHQSNQLRQGALHHLAGARYAGGAGSLAGLNGRALSLLFRQNQTSMTGTPKAVFLAGVFDDQLS